MRLVFFVTRVLFSTSFIGDYSSDTLATCLFEFDLLILGLILAFQWYYSSHNHRLISPELSQYDIRLQMYRGLAIPAISLAAIIITVMGFSSSTMLYMASPLVTYFVEWYTQNSGILALCNSPKNTLKLSGASANDFVFACLMHP